MSAPGKTALGLGRLRVSRDPKDYYFPENNMSKGLANNQIFQSMGKP